MIIKFECKTLEIKQTLKKMCMALNFYIELK